MKAYSTCPTDFGILQEEEGVMRKRWRCEVEEEYLDPWTSEEGRCGGDGGRRRRRRRLQPLAGAGRVDLFSTRPNPLASKPVGL